MGLQSELEKRRLISALKRMESQEGIASISNIDYCPKGSTSARITECFVTEERKPSKNDVEKEK